MKRDPSGYWHMVVGLIKGGPGSGSWNGPGDPRFAAEGKVEGSLDGVVASSLRTGFGIKEQALKAALSIPREKTEITDSTFLRREPGDIMLHLNHTDPSTGKEIGWTGIRLLKGDSFEGPHKAFIRGGGKDNEARSSLLATGLRGLGFKTRVVKPQEAQYFFQ